jgi:hypothetical protein
MSEKMRNVMPKTAMVRVPERANMTRFKRKLKIRKRLQLIIIPTK